MGNGNIKRVAEACSVDEINKYIELGWDAMESYVKSNPNGPGSLCCVMMAWKKDSPPVYPPEPEDDGLASHF